MQVDNVPQVKKEVYNAGFGEASRDALDYHIATERQVIKIYREDINPEANSMKVYAADVKVGSKGMAFFNGFKATVVDGFHHQVIDGIDTAKLAQQMNTYPPPLPNMTVEEYKVMKGEAFLKVNEDLAKLKAANPVAHNLVVGIYDPAFFIMGEDYKKPIQETMNEHTRSRWFGKDTTLDVTAAELLMKDINAPKAIYKEHLDKWFQINYKVPGNKPLELEFDLLKKFKDYDLPIKDNPQAFAILVSRIQKGEEAKTSTKSSLYPEVFISANPGSNTLYIAGAYGRLLEHNQFRTPEALQRLADQKVNYQRNASKKQNEGGSDTANGIEKKKNDGAGPTGKKVTKNENSGQNPAGKGSRQRVPDKKGKGKGKGI